jgi:aspartyl-tRNA(Asn)/glutamyl-tRNA(Gln) amidotransferase subunit C
MSLDRSTVEKVAQLAKLAIDEDDKDRLAAELNAIIGFVEQLSELDTEGVEPMTSVVQANSPLRADVVNDGNIPDKVLANAPERVQDFYAVPKVIE